MELLKTIPPLIQLVLIIGSFVLLLLIACSRTVARNLVMFLSDLLHLYERVKRVSHTISEQQPIVYLVKLSICEEGGKDEDKEHFALECVCEDADAKSTRTTRDM